MWKDLTNHKARFLEERRWAVHVEKALFLPLLELFFFFVKAP